MFSVGWSSDTQLVLFELWALAEPPVQARISAAVNKIEPRLAQNPWNEGESRGDDLRITFESPLGIIFSIDDAAKSVTVLDVWLYA
jgi:hypothetical protein